jgi:diaminopimelate epimerase
MIPFVKMHGIGNDYIYINGFEHAVRDPVDLAKRISDRHFGVGGDGLILVLPPENGVQADVRMRMFNADGSESEMCGNGIRCVCKLAHDDGLSTANPMRIQTGRGVLSLDYTTNGTGKVDCVTVDMGEPVWEDDRIPVNEREMADLLVRLDNDFDNLSEEGFECLSLGNPHIVFFVREVARVPLERWGPIIENHRAFPNRVNAHFVQINSRCEVTMRTWERGSGITLACGTGAAAVCAAGAASKQTDREILVHLPGGELVLRWDEKTNHVFKTGPATEVFRGVWCE